MGFRLQFEREEGTLEQFEDAESKIKTKMEKFSVERARSVSVQALPGSFSFCMVGSNFDHSEGRQSTEVAFALLNQVPRV